MKFDGGTSGGAEAETKAQALLALLAALEASGYDFVTPTPSVSRRGLGKAVGPSAGLRAIFGWSRPFARSDLDPTFLSLLERAGMLLEEGELCRSAVRVSRLAKMLFLHSAFPATGRDAVFLGPDSYRFARFIAQATTDRRAGSIAEIGCGAGVGGLVAARLHLGGRLDLGDINPAALELAQSNAANAGIKARICQSDGMSRLDGPYDLIVANPPYVAGASGRTYKDGGDMHGARMALDWAGQAAERLTPGGRFVLYTGSAILDGGADVLGAALENLAAGFGYRLTYEEIDPDIFSGELRREAYTDVERIAAVGAVLERPA
ncbi:methyltransferase [Caulobacter flavus]|uniref:Methyltransferase n=1 Tax=Caulobacter flavus TaxID=1679497 RepID=A0A2N5CP73_9CAUL|nr:methyltransferase [Caulobacter flavus]AYV48533.1 methyltransferase [Caulobacter flavus]PLR08751.1 methyltransferase [Caulobacter flavus]